MSFSQIVTAPTRELDFCSPTQRKKRDKSWFSLAASIQRFLLFQDAIFMLFFMISHNPSFYINKTMFSRLHPLYYSTPRRLKSGKMVSADAFWSSRARMVYILQEELNVFFILSDISSCLAQICDFQGLWFCLSKTKVFGARTMPKTAPRQLRDSLKGPYREPLRASWPLLGSSWLSWALLGCLGAVLG